MTDASMQLELDPVSWVEPHADGRFGYAPEGTGVLAKQYQVMENGELIDVIAWPVGNSSGWWSLRGIASHLGASELRSAWWQKRPAKMVGSPQEYLDRAGGAFVVIDWASNVARMVGAASAVDCARPELAAKLYRTLLEQAMPRIAITVSGKPWRPAT